jgi:predicted dehydrogenase
MLYNRHPSAAVTAIADPSEEAFKAGAERRKAGGITEFRKYLDPEEMFRKEKGKTDWMIIASPDDTHYEMSRKALEEGFHVFVEKPFCQTLEQADHLISLAESKKLRLVVGCELRYAEPVRIFKERLARGDAGKIITGYCIDSISKGYTYFLRNYRQKRFSRNLLFVKGIHSLDLIRCFLPSDPVQVYAQGGKDFFGTDPEFRGRFCRDCLFSSDCPYSAFTVPSWGGEFGPKGPDARDHCVWDPSSDAEDNISLTVRNADGTGYTFHEIHFAPQYTREFHFIGTTGKLSLVLDQTPYGTGEPFSDSGTASISLTRRNLPEESENIPAAPGSHWGGDERMRDALITAFLSGNTISPDGREARASLAVAAAAELSMNRNGPVKIPQAGEKMK